MMCLIKQHDIVLDNGTHKIKVDSSTQKGEYQNILSGCGGNLTFDDYALTGYTGLGCLPTKVILQMREAVFTVGAEFEQ